MAEKKSPPKSETAIVLTANLGEFKKIIDLVRSIVDDCTIEFQKAVAKIKVVDPAHVAMLEVEIQKKFFSSWKIDKNMSLPFELGVDLDKMNEILRIGATTDEVILTYDQKKSKIRVNIGNLQRSMSLYVQDSAEPKTPDLEYAVEIPLDRAEAARFCKGADDVAEHISIHVDGTDIKLIAMGDTDSLEMEYTTEDPVSEEHISSMYPLDYFRTYIDRAPADVLTVKLSNQYPLRAEGEWKNVHTAFLLAPRIEGEGD